MKKHTAIALLMIVFYWWFVPYGASYRIGPFGTMWDCEDAKWAYSRQGIYGSCQYYSD